MKILVTGSSGMVGRNMSAHEIFHNHDLLLVNRKNLDLFDEKAVRIFFDREKPDIIVHAAARVAGIDANRMANSMFMVENAKLAINVIQTAREVGIPRLINLASSCMYPKDHYLALKESDLLSGNLEPTNEGYAIAKILSTRLCQFIQAENSNYSYQTIIPCNLYGPWDKFDSLNAHLIPSIIRKMHQAKTQNIKHIEVWGDGSSRREFMYVDDLVTFIHSYIFATDSLPSTINVGAGRDYSVIDYYRMVSDILDFQPNYVFNQEKPVGMRQKLIDSSIARSFGWKPTVDLQEGIKRTYEYYKGTLNE